MRPLFRCIALAVSLSTFLPSGTVAAAGSIDDYLGRWEMLIVNSGSTFRSCSLVLSQTGDTIGGEMVWRWGSVWKVEPGSVSLDDRGELLIRRNDLDWAGPLTLRRVGDDLEGSVERKKGGPFYVYARRGREDVDVTGRWQFETKQADGSTSRGWLAIVSSGGSLSATGGDDQGNPVEIQEVSLAGSTLTVVFTAGDGSRARFVGAVRGDRLEGAAYVGDETLPTVATRERRWGEPVKLLAANGLAGWKPRNFQPRKFGWTCENAILSNGEKGDIDIQSEAAFDDFKLHIEYKVVKRGNSGVYLRGRYEVQILDDHEGGKVRPHGNGAVYSRLSPKLNASAPPETWQTYDITLIGRWLTVVLNGKTVIDNEHLDGITGGAISPWESEAGPLLLQGDHGKIWFRNITVTPALP